MTNNNETTHRQITIELHSAAAKVLARKVSEKAEIMESLQQSVSFGDHEALSYWGRKLKQVNEEIGRAMTEPLAAVFGGDDETS